MTYPVGMRITLTSEFGISYTIGMMMPIESGSGHSCGFDAFPAPESSGFPPRFLGSAPSGGSPLGFPAHKEHSMDEDDEEGFMLDGCVGELGGDDGSQNICMHDVQYEHPCAACRLE
jgi:hypothetical protein